MSITLMFSGCMPDIVFLGDNKDKEKDPSSPNKEEEIIIPDLSVPKQFDWNEVYIKVPLSKDINIKDIQVSLPCLKYNKKFIYSYTFDDCTIMAYSKGFQTINKKWIDEMRSFHVGQPKTTGYIPTNTLGYTDGCGNERRFALGVAIWPDAHSIYIDDFMNPTNHKADKYYPHLTWRDIVPIIDFGGDIYFHDVNTNNEKTVESILKGMAASQKITEQHLGRKMKILTRPNGDNNYITAGNQYDDIVFMTVEGTPDDIAFNVDVDLKKNKQCRRFVEPLSSLDRLLPDIETKIKSNTYAWIHDFSHGPDIYQYILDLYTFLNNKYGKDGNDQIWFATLDEVYEYNNLRRNIVVEKSISDNVLTLRFTCPSSDLANEFQYHRDFSILLEGASLPSNPVINSGKNVYGLSFAQKSDNQWMINIDCNKMLLDKAERYTSIYKKEKTEEAKEDALYFANQLKKELKADYLNQLK